MNILLTGGAGYIGSHTAVVLSEAGYKVILFDNFCNSEKSSLNRLKKILGTALTCIEGNVRNIDLVAKTLRGYEIDAVIHFAGLKAVGESVKNPIEYYANNVCGTVCLLEAMRLTNVRTLVFSSSATVYGDPQYLPLDENHPTGSTNAYGRTKLHIEQMLKDVADSDALWRIICLRYFNPVGAHSSGLIGESPLGAPNNLMPYIAKVASGELPCLNIFGKDYETRDGTGERDYIHVMDLAIGHLKALQQINKNFGWSAINLSTGRAYSVLEVLASFEKVSGKKINHQILPRRLGDVASAYGDPSLAYKLLGWSAQYTMDQMQEDAWRWELRRGSNDWA
ncbi:UDP-glucose 4-epimerase GalE [Polynucleobacter paneuropaeus]|nr:UDP-glucose 4-epimerase GalE [Polynucleobacter paneuropaeus]